MRSKQDREESGFEKPIRQHRRAKAFVSQTVFISPRNGAAILAPAFRRYSPKPNGLVRKASRGLNQNPSRQNIIPFVRTA
jgi:hypothetical protein